MTSMQQKNEKMYNPCSRTPFVPLFRPILLKGIQETTKNCRAAPINTRFSGVAAVLTNTNRVRHRISPVVVSAAVPSAPK